MAVLNLTPRIPRSMGLPIEPETVIALRRPLVNRSMADDAPPQYLTTLV
jgi:hypothetical protein